MVIFTLKSCLVSIKNDFVLMRESKVLFSYILVIASRILWKSSLLFFEKKKEETMLQRYTYPSSLRTHVVPSALTEKQPLCLHPRVPPPPG